MTAHNTDEDQPLKLLYVSAIGKKVELQDRSSIDGHTIVDLDSVRRQIAPSLALAFPGDVIDEASEALSESTDVSPASIAKYDVIVCDLTSSHGAVLFTAGMSESLGKPTIYVISDGSPHPGILQRRRLLTYSLPSLSKDFLDALQHQVRLARDSPATFLQTPAKKQAPKAFISYCHKDRPYLDRLLVHLKPLTKSGAIDLWVDTRIKAGDRWRDAIQSALDSASIAILLISADFLASDFIVDDELPPLLSKAQVNGTRIMPLLLSPSRFSREKSLQIYQSINSPSEPLSLMADDAREVVYDRLAQEIEAALSTRAADSN